MENLNLITCIVQRSIKEKIVTAATDAGAHGVTYYYGRGTGIRESINIGSFIRPEKEIILIVVSEEKTDDVFDAVVSAGNIYKKGYGIAYINKIDRAAGFYEE